VRSGWRGQRLSLGREQEERLVMGDVGRLRIGGIEIEALRGGSGRSALLLHGFQTLDPRAPFLAKLAAHARVFAPSLPGFGTSARPEDFDTVYDLVRHTLDLIESVPGGKVTLIGFSFGGWLAAEAAVLRPAALERLVLVDAVGIRISDRETRDILDIFNLHPELVKERTFYDPGRFAPDFDAMDDAALVAYARNREALCLYAWNPLLYNPQLKGWLHRIAVPTLVLWGARDGVVTPDYGRAFAGLIPGARFELIADAGHHPEIEQPGECVARIARFMGGEELPTVLSPLSGGRS
jgi:pimeloyl-ACP methyl ester carboxylesterase